MFPAIVNDPIVNDPIFNDPIVNDSIVNDPIVNPMTVINELACNRGRRDEIPNQELAAKLARSRDGTGIAEIAANLRNKDKNIAADCIKVLYEIGYIDPSLIAPHADAFLALLTSKQNRMVWGAMLALATIGRLAAGRIFEQVDLVVRTVENGSVITQDGGIAALAGVASVNDGYRKRIVPFLLQHLRECRPKDIPQHCEKTVIAIDKRFAGTFRSLLLSRIDELTPPQRKRVEKVIVKIGAVDH